MLTKNRLNRKGFTLIELLVVILILAILAALVVPSLLGHTDDAKRAKAATDVASLSAQIQTFKLDTGRLPSTEEGFNALRTRPSDVTNWNGPYMQKSAPPDPWGNEYIYENQGDSQYLVKSYGSDSAEGGTGNAADISNQDENPQPTQ